MQPRKQSQAAEGTVPSAGGSSCLLICAVLLIASCGCASRFPSYQPGTAAAHEALRNRTETVFEWAQLYKPTEVIDDPIVATLAPLLFLEITTNAPSATDVSGEVGSIQFNDDAPWYAPFLPTLYYQTNALSLGDANHPQVSFLWFHPPDKSSSAQTARVQGVRITLDSQERPVIWEVLSDSSGFCVIFVSKSLESLAAREHGLPLPGRRFSIETAIQEHSRVVVAAVIEDGPLPMGPIVHVRADTFEVNALICRCMPAQVRNLTSTTTFQMKPMRQIQPFLDELIVDYSSTGSWSFIPGAAGEDSLDEVLRLPSHF